MGPTNLNLDDGNWHHLVLTTREDGYKGYNVYVDGILDASSPAGEGHSNPADSEIWLAAGGDPIDPIGPIRLCGREKEDRFDDRRYFRGQVAHFSVWNSALSHLDVAKLNVLYTNEYGLPANDGRPAPAPVDSTCSEEV